MVKCWDLEANKVIRHYHGHLSGVYSLSLHPTLDVLVTAGRDASARVWDMRTKAQIHVLAGHTATVADVKCQESEPQVVTGSMDSTIRSVRVLYFIVVFCSRSIQTLGPCVGKDNDDSDTSQKVRSSACHPPYRVFFWIRLCRRKQHQKVEVSRGSVCVQLQWA